MPANLPPEYFEQEKKFRQAKTIAEKISALEELISKVPKHKGTDKLRAELRRKLSRLREESFRKKKAQRQDLYSVEKEGASQVVLVGFANSGKSSLLKSLTNANPVVAPYPMSTVVPISGMMPYEDIQFQLVDLPPVGNDSTDGWVSGIVRNADVLMLVVDMTDEPDIQAELLIDEIRGWKIEINTNDEVSKKEGFVYKPSIIVANKCDTLEDEDGKKRLKEKYENLYPLVFVSATKNVGFDELKRKVFEGSHIIRVYTKEPGKKPDLDQPFVLPQGSTVLDLAEAIHKDFVEKFNYACIWGSSKFPGQRVQKGYILKDKDIVEFHLK